MTSQHYDCLTKKKNKNNNPVFTPTGYFQRLYELYESYKHKYFSFKT